MRPLMLCIPAAYFCLFLASAPLSAQDFDILGAADSLSAKSSELQKVQAELQSKREEVKKEAEEVKAEEEKVRQLEAAAADDSPLEGPFILYMGQYSNTRGSKHGEFDNFLDARAKGQGHMRENATKQPNYRITDKNGNDLEYDGLFGSKMLNQARINRPANAKPGEALAKARTSLAAKRATYNKNLQAYLSAKADYDKQLADYNSNVDQLNQALPAAIKEAGTPTPTAADLNAPKSDYGLESLIVVDEVKDKTVKDGEAVSLLKEVAKLPEPKDWAKGDKVAGGKIRTGTPIATFDGDGNHKPGAGSHSAIFVTQNKNGIWVYDQYKTKQGVQRPVAKRFIHNKPIKGSAANDSNSYYVIKKK